MVSFKTHLIATILLISEVCSQFPPCGYGYGCSPRCGPTAPSTGSITSGGHFIVPAIIKPMLPACQPSAPAQLAPSTPNKPPMVSSAPPACVDDYNDSELDRLLYLLISNIIENRKGSGKKQSSPSIVSDSSLSSGAGANDVYESYASGYGDDYDYGGLPCVYATPVHGSGNDQVYIAPSCDNTCPEISVYLRPYSD